MNDKIFADKIIEIINNLELTTTEIADALNKTGIIPLCYPISGINKNEVKVGFVRTMFAANGSNWEVHEDVEKIEANEIPVIFTENCNDRAIIGELVAKYMIEKKDAAAVVIHGLIRDLNPLIDSDLPIWSMGFTPIGCVNSMSVRFPQEKRMELETKYHGGIAICDITGVIVIQKTNFNQEMIDNLYLIKDQEKIWFHCMNELNWDTKKIVCDKAYLYEDISVPIELELSLNRLRKSKVKW
jgi:4-hydroxy-4-methyl-2-oxoglutarate aldolase